MTKKCVRSMIVGVTAFFFFMTQAFAQSPADQMQKRIDDLEKQVNELRTLLLEQQKARAEEKARVDKVEQKVDQAEKTKPASPSAVSTVSSLISDFKFKPYGFIKLDAAYDTTRIFPSSGNFSFYVNDSGHHNDNSFSMTGRQTQLGLYIIAPETYSWMAKGRIEFDFYGDGTLHENKAEPLLRQAYVELTKGKFGIIAGQTNDLISPLAPNTLNYTVGWAAGNIGYRRPQLRFTYTYPVNDRNKFIGALAIARTSGTINEDFGGATGDGKNDGEDVGIPTVQARLAYVAKLFAGKDSTFGVSGHYGEEEIDSTGLDHQKQIKSWSANVDFEIPLIASLSLKGEGFVGNNLDDYLGGIIQGVNTTGKPIKSVGGWTQLSYQHNKWKYNAGLGIDDPRDSQLGGTTNRRRNAFYFGNFYYNLIPPVNLCLEYSYWETEYVGKRAETNHRIQSSVIYSW